MLADETLLQQLTLVVRQDRADIIEHRLIWGKLEREVEMNRLTEKLAKASGVVQRQSDKIEARADAIIAREQSIERQTEEAFMPHERALSEAERGLSELERALVPMSNGGPPLERSSASAGSLEGQQTTPVPDLKLPDPPPVPQQGLMVSASNMAPPKS